MRKSKGFCSCSKLSPQTDGAPGWVKGWFERLLLRFIPHFDIIKTVACLDCQGSGADLSWTDPPMCLTCMGTGKQTVLYLRRFYIWRSSWIGKNFGDLYLHKIYRSDDDPDPHDHPWHFRTFVLKGGYRDEAWMFTDLDGHGNGYRTRLPGSDDIVRAPATRFRHRRHIHRVILKDEEPAWTFVWTTGYSHDEKGNADWRFITAEQAVPWRIYLGLDANEEHGG